MMVVEDMLDIADHAARSLIRRHGYDICQMDYEDMVSEALIGMLEVDEAVISGDVRGYMYVAAYNSCFDWLWWWHFGKSYAYCRYTEPPRIVDVDEIEIAEICPDESPRCMAVEEQTRLRDILLAGRIKKGQRGLNAAQRDVRIIDLLVQGYNNFGVCQEMGLPYASVNSYRRRIRARLERYYHETIGNSDIT